MNRLNQSTSLYLRQHADNPVNWHPWDETALALARETSTPILLSIGYSACHWCHVMAHESFEDPATAELMNKLFVNIKLDREERPDLDKIYQLSHQLLSNRGGGWPLTVFLDPDDLTPFFAGTYFPPAPRHGLPAFKELLEKLRSWFDGNRDAVKAQNTRLADAITSLQESSLFEGQPDKQVFATAFEQLDGRFDSLHGGFGGAPKFPQAPMLAFLNALSQMQEGFSASAGEMLHESLKKMALSGLRDHLDGGFFRYTVDGSWTIPHFEKMLYDNALLLPLYARAASESDDQVMKAAAEGIAHWLVSEMRDTNGGFYASIDADADGVEGGFHVWTKDELEELLTQAEFDIISRQFKISGAPNFEASHWHLVRNTESTESENGLLEAARGKMLEARARRIPPAIDTKQLTSWNALCVEGLARAGVALDRDDWLDDAETAAAFIKEKLWLDEQLFAVHAKGKSRFPGYLDDYAYLLKALLALLQARWNPAHLEFARKLADTMIAKFEDSESGGFFFSAADQKTPIARLRSLQDDATPAGSGIAAIALETLGHLTAEHKYLEAAGKTIMSSYTVQQQHPLAHASLLMGLNNHLMPPLQVIIYGTDMDEMKAWKAAIRHNDRLNCYILGPGSGHLAVLSGQTESPGQTVAYVCEGLRCLPPVTSSDALQEMIRPMV